MYNEMNAVKMTGNNVKSTVFGTIRVETEKNCLNFLKEIQWKRWMLSHYIELFPKLMQWQIRM